MVVEQVKRIGVIGTGNLGTTLAACAAPRYEVVVKRRDISEGRAEEALQRISRCFPSMVRRNTLREEDVQGAASHISVTADLGDLRDCQLIFDATPDILDLKIGNFRELNEICPLETVFLSTSACLSATALAAGSGRPDRVMTAHFLAPVHVWPLVESVPALQTSPETINLVNAFLEQGLGKTVARCKDTPGLIQDYFLFAYFNHAIRLLASGAATVEDIDAVVKMGFGVRLGPFELMDHLGMGSQILATKGILEQSFNPAFVPPPLLQKMVEAGYTGRAAGKGWYVWDKEGNKIGPTQLP